MTIIIGILAVVVALYLIGAVMGSKGILGDLFNIIFMIIRKLWGVFVVVVIILILMSAFN